MSRVGKQPIIIPGGVTIDKKENKISVKGPKGQLSLEAHPAVQVDVQDKQVVVSVSDTKKEVRALHGLVRSLINNMVLGVTEGTQKKLLLEGVGYRAKMEGSKLVLSVGFSHPVEYVPPEGIKISVKDQTQINIEGIDKQLVGEVAASIRRYSPVEPYKGKGIRYEGERVRRKQGKKVQ